MKHINPSINVKYIIEVNNGTAWEEVRSFTRIQIAIDYLDELKELNPNKYFRFIRSEWEVIE
jgi:hypothetical protein